MKNFILVFLTITLFACGKNNETFKSNYKEGHGYVQDKETAIKIAEAVWLPIYGKRIYEKIPFEAELIGDTIWTVMGSTPINYDGGSPYIVIQKSDGKILEVEYGK